MHRLPVVEMLNYTYARFVEGLDADARREFDMALLPDHVDVNELLPPALRGLTPPAGWRAIKDPWS